MTDADIVLGYLNPHHLLSGKMEVHLDLAKKAIDDHVGRPLGLTTVEAASAIRRLVNAAMANAIRLMTVSRGRDPRDFAMVAFGGAGPVHAVEIAVELEMPWVVIPPYPGVTSAIGLAVSDVVHDHIRTVRGQLATTEPARLDEAVQVMEDAAMAELADDRVAPEQRKLLRSADLRYTGQGHALNIALPESSIDADVVATLAREFHHGHEERYGFQDSDRDIEIVSLRLRALGVSTRRAAVRGRNRGEPAPGSENRNVHFADSAPRDVPVYERRTLAAGTSLEGPCIVEQLDSTIVVPPGFIATTDEHFNMIVGKEVFTNGR